MVWQQVYDPFHNMFISTALAAIPVVVMLVALGFLHIKAHIAAGLGLVAALLTEIPGSSAAFDRGFVVYSNAANVKRLQDQLKQAGFTTHTEKVATSGGESLRLKAGSFSSRQDAVALDPVCLLRFVAQSSVPRCDRKWTSPIPCGAQPAAPSD